MTAKLTLNYTDGDFIEKIEIPIYDGARIPLLGCII